MQIRLTLTVRMPAGALHGYMATRTWPALCSMRMYMCAMAALTLARVFHSSCVTPVLITRIPQSCKLRRMSSSMAASTAVVLRYKNSTSCGYRHAWMDTVYYYRQTCVDGWTLLSGVRFIMFG